MTPQCSVIKKKSQKTLINEIKGITKFSPNVVTYL